MLARCFCSRYIMHSPPLLPNLELQSFAHFVCVSIIEKETNGHVYFTFCCILIIRIAILICICEVKLSKGKSCIDEIVLNASSNKKWYSTILSKALSNDCL